MSIAHVQYLLVKEEQALTQAQLSLKGTTVVYQASLLILGEFTGRSLDKLTFPIRFI